VRTKRWQTEGRTDDKGSSPLSHNENSNSFLASLGREKVKSMPVKMLVGRV